MAQTRSIVLTLAILVLAGAGMGNAQTKSSRLAGEWRATGSVPIVGSKPPVLSTGGDMGAAPANEPLQRMILLLAPSLDQQKALDAELAELQNPASGSFHHWLTPAEFADRYANSESDVAAVANWLRSEGFAIAPIPSGRGWIEFSGNVGQFEHAFETRVDMAGTMSGPRPVIVGGISVPGALRPLVQGLVSLDGVESVPAITTPLPAAESAAKARGGFAPRAALNPQDAAGLLHLDALHSAGIDGTGETIAIASRSAVNVADIEEFRTQFGLPATNLKVVSNGADAGFADDRAGATLEASWAGVAAPGARILLVPTASTSATDGLDLSLAAIVDGVLARTVLVGYSTCEAGLSGAHQAFYLALYRQAAAEGMAVIAASGDSGPAACQQAGNYAPVSSGFGVNALASTPWDTSVGVTGFSSDGTAADTAMKAWSPVNAADPAYAGGGGDSSLYAAPSWQAVAGQARASTGISALAEGNKRLLPDVAMPTAIDSTGNRGLEFCLSGSTSAGGCTMVRSGGSAGAAALFAGIAALVAEKDGAQGNVAPTLYALSKTDGVFTDVKLGSAKLKCAVGSPGCGDSGEIGFSAGVGYDLATGLGVPDAHALVMGWPKPQAGTATATVTNTTAAGQTIFPSGTVVLSVTVDSGTGSNPPTGMVNFVDQSTNTLLANVTLIAGSGGAASAQATISGVLAVGSHPVVAQYSGDGTYAAANSQAVTVNVAKSSTSIVITPATTSTSAGSAVQVTATISATTYATALPTGSVAFTFDGAQVGTATVTPGSPATAVFSVPIIAAGSHNVQAIYNGDNNYTTSTSAIVAVSAGKGNSATTLTASPASIVPGGTETFTATVAPTNPASGVSYTLTGSVNFYDGGTTLLGTVAITNNTAVLSGVALKNNVSHSITAVYAGDNSWNGSTSNALTLTATALLDSVVLSANHAAVQFGTALILTATVVPAVAPTGTVEANPGGTVIFYSGTQAIGTAQLASVAGTDTASATLTTQTLAAGPNTITAVYQGDAYYGSATSNPLTITVEDFTITPSATNPPTNLNINKGGAGSASFVVAGTGGFNNLVQIVCSVPAQDYLTCSPSPQQVTPTTTVTFVVQTFTTGSVASRGEQRPLFPSAVGGMTLAVLGFFLMPIGRRARKALSRHAGASVQRVIVLMVLLAGLVGAGIGCSSGTTINSSGTPLGVATLKITGSAYVDNTVVSHSVYLTVNVLAPGATAP